MKRVKPATLPVKATEDSPVTKEWKEWMESPEYIYNFLKFNRKNKGKAVQSPRLSKEDVVMTEAEFEYKYLNPWEKPGLDVVNNATLAKIAEKKKIYKLYNDQGDLRAKYDCKSNGFKKY